MNNVSPLLGLLVEGDEVADGRRLGGVVRESVLEVGDEHAELGAPVAHVVQPEDVVAEELHQVRSGVACGDTIMGGVTCQDSRL